MAHPYATVSVRGAPLIKMKQPNNMCPCVKRIKASDLEAAEEEIAGERLVGLLAHQRLCFV